MTVLFSAQFFLCQYNNSRIAALNLTKFCMNMYLDNIVVVVAVMASPSGGACMGGGGSDAPNGSGIPPDYHCPGTHL